MRAKYFKGPASVRDRRTEMSYRRLSLFSVPISQFRPTPTAAGGRKTLPCSRVRR